MGREQIAPRIRRHKRAVRSLLSLRASPSIRDTIRMHIASVRVLRTMVL